MYSICGDRLPIDELNGLMDRHPQVFAYVDDSQGMSWTGPRGNGSVIEHLAHPDRTVVAASLSKAFGASGAAMTSADAELIRRVRACGATLTYGSPIPPPMLGVAIAGTNPPEHGNRRHAG